MLFRWTGAASSAINTPGNWIDEAGNACTTEYPGRVSGRLDDVSIDKASPANSPTGSFDNPLNSIRIGSNFTGTVGASGSPLTFTAGDCAVDALSAGNIYLAPSGTTKMLVTDARGLDISGQLSSLTCTRGTIAAHNLAITNELTVSYREISSDVTLTIGEDVTLPAKVTVLGGNVTCVFNAVGALTQYGGTWNHEGGEITNYSGYSGTFNWSDGDIANAELTAASMIAEATDTPRKITNLRLLQNATFDAGDASNVSVVSVAYDGTASFIPPRGSDVHVYSDESVVRLSEITQVVIGESLNSLDVALAVSERMTLTCITGIATPYVTFAVYAVSDDGLTEEAITGKSINVDPTSVGTIEVWGSELPAGKPKVHVKMTNPGDSVSAEVAVSAMIRRY